MCLGSSNAKKSIETPYNPLAEARKANVQESMLKQPSAYSGASAGPYISNQGQDMASSSPTLPTVKVFRPITPPVPPATVTLTLTETQAKHLKLLLGSIGNDNGKPIIIGWNQYADTKPPVAVIRDSTDQIYYALSAAKV